MSNNSGNNEPLANANVSANANANVGANVNTNVGVNANVGANVNTKNAPAKKNNKNNKSKPVSYMPSWMTTASTQKNSMWSKKENRNAVNAQKANTAKVSSWGKNRALTPWESGVGKAPTNTLGKSAGTGCFKKGSGGVVCGVTQAAAAQMGGKRNKTNKNKNKTNKNKTNKNKNKKNKTNKNKNKKNKH
jgi:hypothetical protein